MFEFWIKSNLYLLLPLVLAGLCMSFFCMKSEEKIRRIWGWGGIVVTGIIGTPIHECSHLLMALLFGYKITDVKLFCPVSGKTTGVLGYVKYRYRKNLFCKIGNFFVGIAPMIGGSLVIWLLFYLLFPDTVMWMNDNMIMGENMLEFLDRQYTLGFGEFVQTFAGHIGSTVVFILLLIAISLHMSISRTDLKGAAYGVIFLELVLLVLSLLQSVLQQSILDDALPMIIQGLWLTLAIGFAASCFTFVFIHLIPSR